MPHVRRLLTSDANGLVAAFWSPDGRHPVLRIKVNTMPILFSIEDAASLSLPIRVDAAAVEAIRTDVALADRVRTAAVQRKAELPEAADVWSQLYSGGFFPMDRDKPVVARFHQASPREKWELIPDFKDPRARQIARWLVGSEWPNVLGSAERSWIEDEFRNHLMKDEAKWTTVPTELERINELLAGATVAEAAILEEYRSYLLQLQGVRRP